MTSNCSRPARPLNSQAVAAADQALYTAHKNDPRPNALFDAAGRKRHLSATDPAQECLRDEWVRSYGNAGGKLEDTTFKSDKRPGDVIQECHCSKATLTVTVRYEPLDAPVKDAAVTISGPATKSLTTDATGIAKFTDLPPGQYEITSRYVGTNKLADHARLQIGSTDWARATAHPPFPRNTWKCNLFVFDVTTEAGFPVPQKPHEQKKFGITFGTVMLPPNAEDWANSSSTLITYPTVATPEPGDVVAYANPAYTAATGHVGIVSYPKNGTPETKTLSPGDNGNVKQIMRRQSVSAGGVSIDEDDQIFWHYYDEGNTVETSRILFRRMSP